MSPAPSGADRDFAPTGASTLRSTAVLRKSNTAEPRDLGDQFALLVSGVVDYGIFMLDPTGVIVTWNEGAQRIKGYAAGEIIGRHFSVFYPAEEVRNRKPDWELEVARREGRYEEEGWRVRKDGTRFWANVIITALRNDAGELRGFSKLTRDLTERKHAEDAVARLNLELEDRVRERTAELAAANTDLSHKNRENE